MSQIDNDNSAANGGETGHDTVNQVALHAAKGNDGRQQMLVLVDFDPRHVLRALFNVPTTRSKGLVTLADGRVLHEKQLSTVGDFLSLRERVEYRHRVVCLGNLFLFPRWDLDGPDLRFFGDWSPRGESMHPLTSLSAGPWVLDGRQMVADARDMTLLLAEAAMILHGSEAPITLQIFSPMPSNFEAQRGWKLQKGPYDAWWSGVRKAAETLSTSFPNIRLVAIDETNPFAECTRQVFVQHSSTALDDAITCIPCDPFGSLGMTELEQVHLTARNIVPQMLAPQLMMGLVTNSVPFRASTLVPSHRHVLWNPKAKLALFNSKYEKKSFSTPLQMSAVETNK